MDLLNLFSFRVFLMLCYVMVLNLFCPLMFSFLPEDPLHPAVLDLLNLFSFCVLHTFKMNETYVTFVFFCINIVLI